MHMRVCMCVCLCGGGGSGAARYLTMHESVTELPLVHGPVCVHVLATPVVFAVEELPAVLVAA
jgi:hypothetical protein